VILGQRIKPFLCLIITPLGRGGHRLEDNIRMNLRKVGWEGVDLMHLAQDRDQWRDLVNVIMKLQVP